MYKKISLKCIIFSCNAEKLNVIAQLFIQVLDLKRKYMSKLMLRSYPVSSLTGGYVYLHILCIPIVNAPRVPTRGPTRMIKCKTVVFNILYCPYDYITRYITDIKEK